MRMSVIPTMRAFTRVIFPFLFCFFLLVFLLVPLYVQALSNVKPFLPFIPIYYFALYLSQDRFSYGFVFLVGLFSDLLLSLPFGTMTLTCLLFFIVVLSQRPFLFGKPFSVVFTGFIAIGFAATLFQWLLMSVYYATFLRFSMPFISYLLLVCCYFPISLICGKITAYYHGGGMYD